MLTCDKPQCIRLLPDRQTRAGCAPDVHDFGVRLAGWAQPLKEIKDQGVNGINHANLR